MDKITFEEVCDLEPAIRRAYNLARMIGRRRGQAFCANALWYEFFKPIICHVVGHNRKPSGPFRFEPITFFDLARAPFKEREPTFPEITIATSQSTDPRLKTSKAYDAAYFTIYEALPDCNHPGRMCW